MIASAPVTGKVGFAIFALDILLVQVVHLPTRSLFYCPLSLLSVRPSLELVAVKFVFQVWAMVEGPPFHQNTQGQGMAMQMHL